MELDWDDWRTVQAAWRHGTFSAAADALGVGQATVSRRVARAEQALGHVLFDRHRQGLRPTPAATSLAPHLEAMEAAARGALQAVESLETEPEGVVRVAAMPGACVDWMPRLALWLAARHPKLRLEVLADVAAADLGRRDADLALRTMATPDDGVLLQRRLTTVQGGLYAAPSLVASLPDPCPPEAVPLVTWSAEHADIPIARALTGSMPGPVVFSANDHLVLRAAVQQGVGATLLEATEAALLGLVAVPTVVPELPPVPLYLVVHRALRHVPRVAAVIEGLEALVARFTAGRAG